LIFGGAEIAEDQDQKIAAFGSSGGAGVFESTSIP
jgi:hypothetical protein